MARIILAEDDDLIGELVVECLSRAGHAVGWLTDGREALAAMKFRPPHLAILDQRMAHLTGNEVLREMRLDLRLVTVPVIMLTAVCGESDQNIAYFDGADDYITKPFAINDLVGRAEWLIAGKLHRTFGAINREGGAAGAALQRRAT